MSTRPSYRLVRTAFAFAALAFGGFARGGSGTAAFAFAAFAFGGFGFGFGFHGFFHRGRFFFGSGRGSGGGFSPIKWLKRSLQAPGSLGVKKSVCLLRGALRFAAIALPQIVQREFAGALSE